MGRRDPDQAGQLGHPHRLSSRSSRYSIARCSGSSRAPAVRSRPPDLRSSFHAAPEAATAGRGVWSRSRPVHDLVEERDSALDRANPHIGRSPRPPSLDELPPIAFREMRHQIVQGCLASVPYECGTPARDHDRLLAATRWHRPPIRAHPAPAVQTMTTSSFVPRGRLIRWSTGLRVVADSP